MVKIGAGLLRAALCATILSAFSTQGARAQATQGGQTAVDPAYEAAKKAFESLSEADRRGMQDALVWTGDFNGVVGGAFGRNTRNAIAAFAKRSNLPTDGALDAKGRELLLAAAATAKTGVGFGMTSDPRTGAALGLPLKILVKRTDSGSGSRWSATDNAVALETMQTKAGDGDLQALFDKLKDSTPARKVTYKFFRPEFFVVTGEVGKTVFYTRVVRGIVNGAGMVRGYTLTYPTDAKRNDRVSIAIANAFDAFPATPSVVAANADAGKPAPPTATPPAASAPPVPRAAVVASGVAVAPDRVVTALAACVDPKVGGKSARIVKQDEKSGLMLLEALGLGAKPLTPTTASAAPQSAVLVLYEASGPAAAAGAPAGVAMAASGEILAPASPGQLSRVIAPLQEQAGGGAVFDRNGAFVGIVGAGKPPVRVAGIVPQSAWPLVDAPALGAFLAANGVNLRPISVASAQSSAAETTAAARGALFPVICTR